MAAFIWFHPRVYHQIFYKITFVRKPCHNDCIDVAFPQYVLSDGIEYYSVLRRSCHNDYIDGFFPQYVFSDGTEDYGVFRKLCHNGCIDIVSPQCVFSYE